MLNASCARSWQRIRGRTPSQHVLGRALLAQGRPQEAIAPLEAAARHGDPVAETNLGIALDQSGRPADALVWLERAVTRQPPFEHAFYELGVLLVSMRRPKDAEAVLKRGLAINPNSVEVSILLGDIFLKRPDRDSAKLAFARALANEPSHPGALFGMGTVMMLEGEYARAAQRLQQAVAQDPAKFQTRLDPRHLPAGAPTLGRRLGCSARRDPAKSPSLSDGAENPGHIRSRAILAQAKQRRQALATGLAGCGGFDILVAATRLHHIETTTESKSAGVLLRLRRERWKPDPSVSERETFAGNSRSPASERWSSLACGRHLRP